MLEGALLDELKIILGNALICYLCKELTSSLTSVLKIQIVNLKTLYLLLALI
jgi:hypothetical protein